MAATKVAEELGFIEDDGIENCLMHQGNKIAEWGIGFLKRSKKKMPYDPFDECVSFINRAHSTVKYFANSTKNKANISELHKKICDDLRLSGIDPEDVLHLESFKTIKNGTRIAAPHTMIKSLIRNKILICMWIETNFETQSNFLLPDYFIKDEIDYKILQEIEAILTVCSFTTTSVQQEKCWSAAYSVVFSRHLLKRLSAVELDVIMLTKSDGRRISRKVEEFENMSLKVLERCIEETKHRFGDYLLSNDNDRLPYQTLAAVGLDLRTNSGGIDDIPKSFIVKNCWPAVKKVAENFFESQWDNENYSAALGDDNGNQVDTEDDGLDLNINLSPIVNQKSTKKSSFMHDFQIAYQKFIRLKIDWKEEFPLRENWNLRSAIDMDLTNMYRKFGEDYSQFHIIPKLAMIYCPKNLSESFAERIFSAGKLLLNNKSNRMKNETFNMRICMRMNKIFFTWLERIL